MCLYREPDAGVKVCVWCVFYSLYREPGEGVCYRDREHGQSRVLPVGGSSSKMFIAGICQ